MRRLNVASRKKALNVVKELDAFPKVAESYKETSSSSGGVSILVFLFIAVLVASEISYYSGTDLEFEYNVDTEIDGKLDINIDMTIAMPCKHIGADVLDLTGQSTNSFGRLEEENVHFELSDNQKHYLQMLQTMNSYFKDEYHALHQFLWLNGHKSIPTSLPDRRDNLTTPHDACRLTGKLTVNKVAGNFHVTAGKSIPVLPRGHAHLSMMMAEKDYNFTHRIDRFSFGPPAGGIINPLDGEMKVTKNNFHIFQYFMQVVPTKVSTRIYNVDTYQYAVTEKNRSLDHSAGSHGTPGIYVKYDLSPLGVSVLEVHQPFWQLIIRLCGIIGGVFATSGVIHSLMGCFMDVICCRLKVGRYGNTKSSPRHTVGPSPPLTNPLLSQSNTPHPTGHENNDAGLNTLCTPPQVNNTLIDNSGMESISLSDSSLDNSNSSHLLLDNSNSTSNLL